MTLDTWLFAMSSQPLLSNIGLLSHIIEKGYSDAMADDRWDRSVMTMVVSQPKLELVIGQWCCGLYPNNTKEGVELLLDDVIPTFIVLRFARLLC